MIDFINGGSCIQMTLDTIIVKSSLARALSQARLREVQIFFHLLMFVEACIFESLLDLARSYEARCALVSFSSMS